MSRIMGQANRLAEHRKAERLNRMKDELRRLMPAEALRLEADRIVIEGSGVISRFRLDPVMRAFLGDRS